MSKNCTTSPVYGRIPFTADPFGLMLGQQQSAGFRPRLRFEGEGGTGAGAGGAGAGDGAGAGGAGAGGAGAGAGAGGTGDGDAPLDAPGIRALERERQEKRAAKDALKGFEGLGLTVEQIREMVEKNDPKNPERIAKEATRAAETAANERISTVLRTTAIATAAAAAGFANADDAIRFLDADEVKKLDVDLDKLSVTPDQVKKLVDDLVTARPYLTTNPAGSARDAGIGSRGTTAGAVEPTPGLGRLTAAYEASNPGR